MAIANETKVDFDAVDRQLLRRLMHDGRATWADLADSLGLTAPAVAQRVRRLEVRGVIKQFAAWVAPEAVAPVAAYVAVQLARPELRERFRRHIAELEQIQECMHIAGDHDYLLKVRCGSLAELEALVSTTLAKAPGVGRMRTNVVLSAVKETPVLPLPAVA